jgi:hypothetical protein
MNDDTKSVISVAEMARMVGLSRQRFYQLMGSTFPFPLYDIATKRPFYPEDLQQVCLEVRKRNCGINGKPVMFYCTGHRAREKKSQPRSKRPVKKRRFEGLIDGLAALGLTVSDDQVATAVKDLFPAGINCRNEGEVLRDVFVYLKQKESQS